MNYKEIFFKNNYEIANSFIFTLKEFKDVKNHKLFKKNFAIITAFNPLTKKLTFEQNKQRNKKLEEEIQSLGYDYLDARGFLEEHSEDGFLIFHISFDDAIELARKHHQYAIFYNGKAQIGYYECKNKQIIIERHK